LARRWIDRERLASAASRIAGQNSHADARLVTPMVSHNKLTTPMYRLTRR
jgi:hypothetical protein